MIDPKFNFSDRGKHLHTFLTHALPDDIEADQAEVKLPTEEPKDNDETPEKESD